MENLIKVVEKQIEKLEEIQLEFISKKDLDGVINLSQEIMSCCITLKELKDKKYDNENKAKSIENINKSVSSVVDLIKVFTPNNKKSTPTNVVNHNYDKDINEFVRNIKSQLNTNRMNLMK